MQKMTEDTRRIEVLNDNANCITHAIVSKETGITKIECYEENGPMAPVPYFAIWKGDFIAERICGVGLSVVYFRDGDQSGEDQ